MKGENKKWREIERQTDRQTDTPQREIYGQKRVRRVRESERERERKR